MWHSGSKCQRIRAFVKASHNRLKAALALRVRKLGPTFLALKLGEFPLFDGFLDLAKFLSFEFPNLNNFRSLDDFPDFLASSLPLSPTLNLMTSSSPLPTSGPDTSGDLVVFNIEVSRAAILLELGWIVNRNWQSLEKLGYLVLTLV